MSDYKVQTLEAFGTSYVEKRYEPESDNVGKITIEFYPNVHPLDELVLEYEYPYPVFVFGELVALRQQWEYCRKHGIAPEEEINYYRICALELVAPESESGRLTEAPYWLYGIRCTTGTKELMWLEEEELVALRVIEENLAEF